MDPKILPPFSARNRGAHVQIDSDFPESARTGLLHLLHDLVEREYVGSISRGNWNELRESVRSSTTKTQGRRLTERGKRRRGFFSIYLGKGYMTSAKDSTALKYFRHVSQPDPENAVKEAVCAVEATARALFPSPGAKTLGAIVKSITGTDPGKFIAQTFHALYGFRSGGEGVGHGGTAGGAATQDIAEYALALAASQIILLVDLANGQEDDVPI
jgi:hypothetical protein